MDLLKKLAISVIATASSTSAMDIIENIKAIFEGVQAGIDIIDYIDSDTTVTADDLMSQALSNLKSQKVDDIFKTVVDTGKFTGGEINQIREQMATTKSDLRQRAEDHNWNDNQKRSANEMYKLVGDGIPFLHRSDSSQVFDLD